MDALPKGVRLNAPQPSYSRLARSAFLHLAQWTHNRSSLCLPRKRSTMSPWKGPRNRSTMSPWKGGGYLFSAIRLFFSRELTSLGAHQGRKSISPASGWDKPEDKTAKQVSRKDAVGGDKSVAFSSAKQHQTRLQSNKGYSRRGTPTFTTEYSYSSDRVTLYLAHKTETNTFD